LESKHVTFLEHHFDNGSINDLENVVLKDTRDSTMSNWMDKNILC